jgi:hypothetical protein
VEPRTEEKENLGNKWIVVLMCQLLEINNNLYKRENGFKNQTNEAAQ